MQIIPQPPGLLFGVPFERHVRPEALQPFLPFAGSGLGIFQAADGFKFSIGMLRIPGCAGVILRRRRIGMGCNCGLGIQHSDDAALWFGPDLHEGINRTLINLHSLLREQIDETAVGRSTLAFRRDELPVGFQFGRCVGHDQTGSNKLQQKSNLFEPRWNLCESVSRFLVALLGKMSDGFFGHWEPVNKKSMLEQNGKEGRECFG